MQVIDKRNYKVYKYVLEEPETSIKVPFPALLLSCKMFNNKISTWFLVEQREKELESTINFLCVNTGAPFQTRLGGSKTKFVNTVISSNDIVWHVFMSEGSDNTDLVQED